MADTQLFYQLPSFTLAGAGCSIGDTSVILSSMLDANGVQVLMANLGTKSWITLEPGNSGQEEQISFTGITVNSNGTSTLTGVSNVAFKSPYTETSGVQKTHPGGAKAIVSNTSAFYDNLASKDNDEIINGVYTFTQSPIAPLPDGLTTSQVATVGYVNGVAIAGAPKATTAVFGISKLSVAAVTASVPIVVGDNDPRVPTQAENDALVGNSTLVAAVSATNVFVTQEGFIRNQETFIASTGTSTAFVLTLPIIPVSYVAGMQLSFKANVASGTAPTINVNGLGAKSLVKSISGATAALAIGDFSTNTIVLAEYDGGAFQMLNTTSNMPTYTPAYTNGTTTKDAADASTTQNIPHGLGRIPTKVRITGLFVPGTATYDQLRSETVYNGTTQSSMSILRTSTGPGNTIIATAFKLNVATTGEATFSTGVVTFDATNIIITWTKTGSPTGIYTFLWEANS